jgi:hypothetical protein
MYVLGRSPVLVVKGSAKRLVMGKTTGTFQENTRVAGEGQIFERPEICNMFGDWDYKAAQRQAEKDDDCRWQQEGQKKAGIGCARRKVLEQMTKRCFEGELANE